MRSLLTTATFVLVCIPAGILHPAGGISTFTTNNTPHDPQGVAFADALCNPTATDTLIYVSSTSITDPPISLHFDPATTKGYANTGSELLTFDYTAAGPDISRTVVAGSMCNGDWAGDQGTGTSACYKANHGLTNAAASAMYLGTGKSYDRRVVHITLSSPYPVTSIMGNGDISCGTPEFSGTGTTTSIGDVDGLIWADIGETTMYLADRSCHRIWQGVASSPYTYTGVVGNGGASDTDGVAPSASINEPSQMALWRDRVYVYHRNSRVSVFYPKNSFLLVTIATTGAPTQTATDLLLSTYKPKDTTGSSDWGPAFGMLNNCWLIVTQFGTQYTHLIDPETQKMYLLSGFSRTTTGMFMDPTGHLWATYPNNDAKNSRLSITFPDCPQPRCGTLSSTVTTPMVDDAPTRSYSLSEMNPTATVNSTVTATTPMVVASSAASGSGATSSGASDTSGSATFQSLTGDGAATISISTTNAEGDNFHPIYVQDLSRIQLRVSQDQFGCTTCPDTMVSIHTDVVSDTFIQMQECGGTRQFLEGVGLSPAICQTGGPSPLYHCAVISEAITASTGATGRSFTGMIYLNVTTSSLVGVGCGSVDTTLYYSYATSATKYGSPFLFKRAMRQSTKLPYAFAMPQGTKLGTFLSETFPGLAASVYTNLVRANVGTQLQGVSIGPLSDPQDIFLYTDETVFATNGLSNDNITSGNVTFACVLDFTDFQTLGSAGTYYCTVDIPATSNYFSIEVSQTDFQQTDMSYDLVDPTGVTTSISGSCGATNGFSGTQGKTGSENTYLSCAGRYMYRTSEPTSLYKTLNITFPASMRSQSSKMTFAALVRFEGRNIPTTLENCTDQFFCVADFTCTPDVCDAVNDCPDAADELGCWDWSVVSKGQIFNFDNEVNSTSIRTVQSFAECRKLATIAATSAFAFDQLQLICIVYRANNTAAAFVAPDTYLVSNSTTKAYDLYVNEAINNVAFEECSSWLHCSGKGQLVQPAVYWRGCRCTCDYEFTGDSCSQRKDLASLDRHVAYVTYAPDGSLPTVTQVTDSLILSQTILTIKNSGYEPYNETDATLEFTVTSRDPTQQDAYRQALLTNKTLQLIRTSLEGKVGDNSTVRFISVTSVVARATPLQGCTFGGLTVDCVHDSNTTASSATLVTSIIVKGQSVQNLQFNYRTLDTLTSSTNNGVRQTSSSSGPNISASCTGSNVISSLKGNCNVTVCKLLFGTPIELTHLHVVASNTSSILDPQCRIGFEVSVKEPSLVSGQYDDTQSSGTHTDPRPAYQIVLVVILFLITAVLLVLGIRSTLSYSSAAMEWALEFALKARTIGGLFISEGFASRYYNQLLVRGHLQGASRFTGLQFILGAIITLIAAGFGLTYYAMSETESTDYRIYFETYRDSLCNNSEFSPVPFQFIELSSLDRCYPVPFPTSETFFVRGRCAVGTVSIGIAPDSVSCGSTAHFRVNRDSCQLATDLGLTGIEGYVKISCLGSQTAIHRTQQLENLVGKTPAGHDLLLVGAPRSDLAVTLVTDPVTNASVEKWPFLSQGKIGDSTFPADGSPGRTMVGFYSKEFFDQDFDGRRILTHYNYDEVVRASISGGSIEARITKAFETEATSLTGDYTNLNESVVGLPSIGNYLLGTVYNSFETDTPRNGKQAGPASHRYFNVRGSNFDMNKYFDQTTDGSFGFTISLWMRANTQSVGFPFVLADGYEDSSLQQSVIVNRLLDILRTDTGTWFQEEDWNVYLGLYVNGPRKTLSLVQAHTNMPATTRVLSAEEQPVPGIIKLMWDLEPLGFSRLLNGLWHKVDLIFFMVNERIAVRLAVDSQTSLAREGFSQCSALHIPQIQYGITRARNVSNVATAQLYDNGVMYVGYFSGAVGRLELEPGVAETAVIALEGTKVMKKISQLSYVSFHILGGLLVTAGFIFALFSLNHTREAVLAKGKRLLALRETGMNLYYAMFINGPVSDPSGKLVPPLTYVEAMVWLDLNDESFVDLLREVLTADGHRFASRTLIRAMYSLGDPSEAGSLPALDMWDLKVVTRLLEDKTAKLAVAKLLTPETLELDAKTRRHLDEERKKISLRKDKDRIYVVGSEASEMSAVTDPSLYEILMPSLQLFQIIGIYASSIEFPEVYEETLGRVFEIFAFNLLQFPEIPTLVTPVLQFSIGILVIVTMAYTGVVDNAHFKQHLAMYAQRRDEKTADEALLHVEVTEALAAATAAEDESVKDSSGTGTSLKQPGTQAVTKPSYIKDLRQRVAGMETVQDRLPVERYEDTLIPPRERSRIDGFFAPAKERKEMRVRGEKVEEGTAGPPPGQFGEEQGESSARPFGVKAKPKRGGADLDSPREIHILLDDIKAVAAQHEADDTEGVIQVWEQTSMDIDGFSNLDKLTEDSPPTGPQVDLKLNLAVVFAENRDEADQTKWIELRCPQSEAKSGEEVDGAAVGVHRGEQLRTVSTTCPSHHWRKLAAMQTTPIYPFDYQPECCIVENGIKCGKNVGTLFCCGFLSRNDKPDPVYEDGSETDESKDARDSFDNHLKQTMRDAIRDDEWQTEAGWKEQDRAEHCYKCHYAVCDDHFKATFGQEVNAKITGKARAVKTRGGTWLLTLCVVGLTTAIFTPFMETCIMVLSCHPHFQCEFTTCWENVDRKFGLAVFLSIVSLVLFGIGIPLGQVFLLARRKLWLLTSMCGSEYKGKYQESVDGRHNEGMQQNEEGEEGESDGEHLHTVAAVLKKAASLESALLNSHTRSRFSDGHVDVVNQLSAGSPSISDLLRRLKEGFLGSIPLHAQWTPSNNWAALREFYMPICREADLKSGIDKVKSLRKNAWRHGIIDGVLSTEEWRNFLAADESGLNLLYAQLEFDWLYLTPIMLFFKFALICPSVLLEPDSIQQLAGVGVMEFVFGVFVTFTNPYRTPWTDIMIHVGSIHQHFFMGFQAFHVVEKAKGNPHALDVPMMSCTIIYLILVFIFIFTLTMWPMISKRLQRRKMAKKLRSLGLFPVSQARLYKKPGALGFNITYPTEEFRPWILIQQRLESYLQKDTSGTKSPETAEASRIPETTTPPKKQEQVEEEKNNKEVGETTGQKREERTEQGDDHGGGNPLLPRKLSVEESSEPTDTTTSKVLPAPQQATAQQQQAQMEMAQQQQQQQQQAAMQQQFQMQAQQQAQMQAQQQAGDQMHDRSMDPKSTTPASFSDPSALATSNSFSATPALQQSSSNQSQVFVVQNQSQAFPPQQQPGAGQQTVFQQAAMLQQLQMQAQLQAQMQAQQQAQMQAQQQAGDQMYSPTSPTAQAQVIAQQQQMMMMMMQAQATAQPGQQMMYAPAGGATPQGHLYPMQTPQQQVPQYYMAPGAQAQTAMMPAQQMMMMPQAQTAPAGIDPTVVDGVDVDGHGKDEEAVA